MVSFPFNSTTTQDIHVIRSGDPDYRPYFEVYEILNDPPADFTDLSYVVGSDFVAPNSNSSDGVLNAAIEAGKDYAIFVTSYEANAGHQDDFQLFFPSTATPPANDDFNDRITLPYSYRVFTTGTTDGATIEGGEPNVNPGNISPIPSVWYEWTSPNFGNEPMDFQIDTLGSSAETYLEVFTGNNFFSPLVLIESDHNSGAGGKSQLTLNTNGDVVYKIRVSSPLLSVGDFSLILRRSLAVPHQPTMILQMLKH